MKKVNKKVNLKLEGLDGNAFVLLGAFRKQAKREGWTDNEVEAVTADASSGDYSHLLQTLISHTQ